MGYQDVMEDTVKVFELVGVAVLLVGGLLAFATLLPAIGEWSAASASLR